ncbi:hypothetical protein [Cloacibacterium normanense]|uniref:hypothetical protein n=1 Tax=Cloacibacterium normanense TaxID=237258 RepID=UPI00352F1C63
MDISIKLPFEQLLVIIKNLNQKEKEEVAKILLEETEVSDKMWDEAVKRKTNFEEGKISSESWQNLKKRI